MSNSDPTHPGNVFKKHIFYCSVIWADENCSRWMLSSVVFCCCSPSASSSYLSQFCLSVILNQSTHSPFTSEVKSNLSLSLPLSQSPYPVFAMFLYIFLYSSFQSFHLFSSNSEGRFLFSCHRVFPLTVTKWPSTCSKGIIWFFHYKGGCLSQYVKCAEILEWFHLT